MEAPVQRLVPCCPPNRKPCACGGILTRLIQGDKAADDVALAEALAAAGDRESSSGVPTRAVGARTYILMSRSTAGAATTGAAFAEASAKIAQGNEASLLTLLAPATTTPAAAAATSTASADAADDKADGKAKAKGKDKGAKAGKDKKKSAAKSAA